MLLNWFKGGSSTATPKVPLDIAVSEVLDLRRRNSPVYIVDLRTQAEFRSGHIKGAHLLPYPELNKRMHELPSEGLIVMVDASARRSRQAAKLLRTYTYEARSLKGGLKAWLEKLVK